MHKRAVFNFGKFKSRQCSIYFSRDYARKGEKNKKALKIKAFRGYIFFIAFFWLRRWDLNLTTSGLWARRATRLLYSAIWCFPFTPDHDGAGDRGRTGTILTYHGILSPGRLPSPPHRHFYLWERSSLGSHSLLYHSYMHLSTLFCKKG